MKVEDEAALDPANEIVDELAACTNDASMEPLGERGVVLDRAGAKERAPTMSNEIETQLAAKETDATSSEPMYVKIQLS